MKTKPKMQCTNCEQLWKGGQKSIHQRRGSESSISFELGCSGLSVRWRCPTKSIPSHSHGQQTYLERVLFLLSSLLSKFSSWRVNSSSLSLNLDALMSANLNDFSAASLAAMAAAAVSSLNFSFFSNSIIACFAASTSCLREDTCNDINQKAMHQLLKIKNLEKRHKNELMSTITTWDSMTYCIFRMALLATWYTRIPHEMSNGALHWQKWSDAFIFNFCWMIGWVNLHTHTT